MPFSLKNLMGSLAGSGKGNSVIGLDIGTSSIKIVQLRLAKGAAVLETYGEIALGPYAKIPIGKAVKLPQEKISEATVDLMKEAAVTARDAGISIPFSSSLITVLDLPKVDNEQLKQIVPIEARKYIPIPVSEASIDWFVIPKDESSAGPFDDTSNTNVIKAKGQEVLLVAIHNEIVRTYQTLASACSITPSFFEIEIFSAIRSSIGSGLAPILFVDIGASTTKIYIVERGVVRLTHLLTVGGQQMTETLARAMGWEFEKAERLKRERGLTVSSTAFSADENGRIREATLYTLTRIFSEINRVLLSFGQRYNKNIAHVCFAGGGASLPGLAEAAKSSLSAEVTIADPFAKTEAPAFMGSVLHEIGPGFAVAVGLAVRALKRD